MKSLIRQMAIFLIDSFKIFKLTKLIRFFFFSILFFITTQSSVAQFVATPPIQDGNISAEEYGNSSNPGPWYMAWDNTNLYVALNATQNYEPAIMYLDISPTADTSGGVASGTNGSITGKNDWGTTPNLPFNAKARLYFLTSTGGSKYAEVSINTGSGWSAPVVISSQLNISGASLSNHFEMYVSWSQLGAATRPVSFNWLGTESSTSGYIYNQIPHDNYSGNSITTPTYFYYQTVANTNSPGTNAVSTGFKSFTNYSNSTFNYTVADTLYDFTLGKMNNTSGNVTVQAPLHITRNLVLNNGSSGMGDTIVSIITDKARYNPGDTVFFTMSRSLPSTVKIRYRQLDSTIAEVNASAATWQWIPPAKDSTGYMVDLYTNENGLEKIYASIAVDVSTDWTYFPRYGFLSAYSQYSNGYMDSVIRYLNRLHINGLQFYDWDYEHHQPLAGTITNPASSWLDIANRTNYKSTIDYYISSAHLHNMKAMSYNLCYGALSDAATDSVLNQWYIYTDNTHTTKADFNITPFLKSIIYLLDPNNTGWQNYLAGKNADVYSVYNFDGYHVDQLGNWGTTYDYYGNLLNVPAGFNTFLKAMKLAAPTKRLVMNAVNQYGQQGNIATSPVDFLYTEVWSPNDQYSDLSNLITNDYTYSNNSKKNVLAAYMDYNNGNNPGSFNTPGILLTDAVIFAFGGSHLEMGEHMLCKEYFPNANLQMKPDLESALINYYDFLTGYQNLLRNGGSFNNPTISSSDGKTVLNNWPPQKGSISVIGKDLGNRLVIHLINFANATSLAWRDSIGTQTIPNTYQNISFKLTTTKSITKLWMASPDINGGALMSVPFTLSGNTITFTLPSLQYWDMIVADY